VNIIRLSERTAGIAQGEADAVAFVDQLIEILGFRRKGLLQKPEEVLALWAFVSIPELDVVAPAGGGILDYQAQVAVLKPILIHYLGAHILVPEYVQN
jgi:hypothetical protein